MNFGPTSIAQFNEIKDAPNQADSGHSAEQYIFQSLEIIERYLQKAEFIFKNKNLETKNQYYKDYLIQLKYFIA